MTVGKFFIDKKDCLLVIVDFQEKLAKAMKKEVLDKVLKNIIRLNELCKLLQIPVLVTEQYPKGLGGTLEELKNSLNQSPIEKICFSCAGEEKFIDKLKELNRKAVILTGMETHVCVWQTALDLVFRDYRVFVPHDAVCSRRKEDWKTGLQLVKDAGGVITCTETLIFQILKKAGTDEFKKMLEFVK
jgi:Amidases related to nicotinamidase